ncbi:hypothetical protein ACKKBF_B13060 [Auxenochlorella protothecoides x Auxenochlorella symbiontica]
MPLVPEKLRARQEVRAALGSQFWGQEAASPRSIDGKTVLNPCEPVPLGLMAPSGLSRTQQLLAAQALGILALPSYLGDRGGLILDRVLARIGGRTWWATLGSRMHAQRAFRQGAALDGPAMLRPLKDPQNYAACLRLHSQIARFLTLSVLMEARDLRPMQRRLDAALQGAAPPAPSPGDEGAAARGTLHMALPGHELTASLTSGQEVVDATGVACVVPLTASLDLSSALDRGDGMQYRIGLHQALAPADSDGSGPLRSTQHVQGAVAVEGEAYLWRAGPRGGRKERAGAASDAGGVIGPEASTSTGMECSSRAEDVVQVLEVDPPRPVSESTHSSASGPAGDFAGEVAKGLDVAQPALNSVAEPAAPMVAVNAGGPQSPGAPVPLEAFIISKQGLEPEATTAPSNSSPAPRPSPLDALNAQVLSALGTLRRAQSALADLRAGGAEAWDLDALGRGTGAGRRAGEAPHSLLTPGPHLKLNGAIGCLGRVPLPGSTGLPLSRSRGQQVGEAAAAPAAGQPGWRASSASLASARGGDAWEPYLRNTSLRVFLSAGISGQLGRFRRRWLDFTAAALRVDVGLTSQHVLGALPAAPDAHTAVGGGWAGTAGGASTGLGPCANPDRHPAFALEGRGTWHALSAGLAQQVWGPLRARCDLRFALDPTYVPADEGERSTVHGLVATALSVRASRLETVVGADCVLPGSGGAARLVVWYSPQRREGMAEVHLF